MIYENYFPPIYSKSLQMYGPSASDGMLLGKKVSSARKHFFFPYFLKPKAEVRLPQDWSDTGVPRDIILSRLPNLGFRKLLYMGQGNPPSTDSRSTSQMSLCSLGLKAPPFHLLHMLPCFPSQPHTHPSLTPVGGHFVLVRWSQSSQ